MEANTSKRRELLSGTQRVRLLALPTGLRGVASAEQLALATGAAAYRWEDLTKAPVSPSMLLNPRRYGDGAKDLWATLNCVQ